LLEVLTDPIDFETVRAALQAAGFVPLSAEVTQRASTTVPLQGDAAIWMMHLIEALKDLKDVENVYTNAEIPDEVLARF
jgi:transcriptional/translational regulatory protein YebC/TACO1